MPVIPGAQQGQVLNAGSPVPVASSENARAVGEGVARTGQALFAFGDALDTAARAAKGRQSKLDLESALGDLDLKKMQYRAEAERARPGDNPYDNVKGFQEKTLEFADEIGNNISDPAIKQEFFAKAKVQLAQDSIPVYANEVKKYDDLGNDKVNKIISQYSAMAYVDPTSVGESLYKVQEIVNQTPDIPEFKRVEALRKAELQIINTSVDKFVDEGKFDEALHNINVVYADRYTAEEKTKRSQEIRNIKWERKTRGWQTDDRMEKEAEKLREKEMDAYQSDTFNLLDQAGSERERESIIQDRGYRAFAAGLIDEKRFNFMTKTSKDILTERDDSAVALGIFDDLGAGRRSISKSKDKVLDLAAEGKLSRPKAEQLWKYLQDAQERMRRDPLYMKKLNAALQYAQLKTKPQDMQEKIMSGVIPNVAIDSEKSLNVTFSILDAGMRGGELMSAARNAVTREFGAALVAPTIKGVDHSESDSDDSIKIKVNQALVGKSKEQINKTLKEAKALMDFRKNQRMQKEEAKMMREQMQKAGEGG